MSRGRHGKGGSVNIAQRLKDLEDRVEALDAGLQEVHPEYANRILDRMHELEEVTRQHANSVFRVLTNQKDACQDIVDQCKEIVAQAAVDADAACQRLDAAADRHQNDGSALRRELGGLKELIDTQSMQCSSDLAKMEALLRQASDCLDMQESLRNDAEEQMRNLSRIQSEAQTLASTIAAAEFKQEQERVVQAARSGCASLPDLIKRAQGVARSREPSVDAGSREPARHERRSVSRGRSIARSDASSRPVNVAQEVLAALTEG